MKHFVILGIFTFAADIFVLIFCVIRSSSKYNRKQEYEQLKKDMKEKNHEKIRQEEDR